MTTRFIDRGSHRNYWFTHWNSDVLLGLLATVYICILVVAPFIAEVFIEPEVRSQWTGPNVVDVLISRPPALLRDVFVHNQSGSSLEPARPELRWKGTSAAWLRDPLPDYPLGSSPHGRNILWSVILGARYLALYGIPATLAGMFVGGTLGIMGSWWNPPRFPGTQMELKGVRRMCGRITSYFIDALDTFPRFILFFTLANVGGISPMKFIMAFIVAIAITVGSQVRVLIQQVRLSSEIQGAEERGIHPIRILWVHLFRVYVSPTLLVQFATSLALFITWEATMAYLDKPPFRDGILTWGVLLHDVVNDQYDPAPWAIFTVGILLVTSALATFKLGGVLHKWSSSR